MENSIIYLSYTNCKYVSLYNRLLHSRWWLTHWSIEQCLMSPPTQYRISGRQFYRSKDPTNSIKVLKEKLQSLVKTILYHQQRHDKPSALTAWEAWTMPFTTQRQNLLGKVDSFSAAWTAVGITAVDICHWRVSATAAGYTCTAHSHPAMTLLTAQDIVLQQISRRVLQCFATYTCVTTCTVTISCSYDKLVYKLLQQLPLKWVQTLKGLTPIINILPTLIINSFIKVLPKIGRECTY